ncbi:MAG: DUF2807 domain-containing protein [Sphingomonadales bacterium]|nr:DUF2807 domain-containing protein [Sphingomonadales bacterium]
MRAPAKGVAAALAAIGLSMPVFASADEVTEERDVATFSRIVVEGGLDIAIRAGETQSVAVTTEASHMDRVETIVRDGVLTIDLKGRRWRGADVEIEIAMAKFEGLEIDGAADATISNIDSEAVEIEISGAGDVSMDGACTTATFEVNGAGDIDAEAFKCAHVDLTINGAGDAEVFASETVAARINGVGDIEVYGNPKTVERQIAGLGDFELK